MNDDAKEELRDAYAEIERLREALKRAEEGLNEAVYMLDPDDRDIEKRAGVFRVVISLLSVRDALEGK